eukprot:442218_1
MLPTTDTDSSTIFPSQSPSIHPLAYKNTQNTSSISTLAHIYVNQKIFLFYNHNIKITILKSQCSNHNIKITTLQIQYFRTTHNIKIIILTSVSTYVSFHLTLFVCF